MYINCVTVVSQKILDIIKNDVDKKKYLWFKEEIDSFINKYNDILNKGSDTEESLNSE